MNIVGETVLIVIFCLEARKRVLSNTKEKLEYFSRWPSPIQTLIKDCEGNIKVSEIHSKKLFELWSKMANKMNLKLPKIDTLLIQKHDKQMSDNSSDESFKSEILSPKWNKDKRNLCNPNQTLEAEQLLSSPLWLSDANLSSLSSTRYLNKEECQSSYQQVNSKIKERVANALANRHMLFTFNPSKLRIRSPIAQRERLL